MGPRTKWELESNAFCIPSPLAPPPTPLPPSISMCAETRKHNSGPSLLPPSRATLYPWLVAVFLEARVGVVDSLIRIPRGSTGSEEKKEEGADVLWVGVRAGVLFLGMGGGGERSTFVPSLVVGGRARKSAAGPPLPVTPACLSMPRRPRCCCVKVVGGRTNPRLHTSDRFVRSF